jgi:hypothetical protein
MPARDGLTARDRVLDNGRLHLEPPIATVTPPGLPIAPVTTMTSMTSM